MRRLLNAKGMIKHPAWGLPRGLFAGLNTTRSHPPAIRTERQEESQGQGRETRGSIQRPTSWPTRALSPRLSTQSSAAPREARTAAHDKWAQKTRIPAHLPRPPRPRTAEPGLPCSHTRTGSAHPAD